MPKFDEIEVEGKITAVFPNSIFKVELIDQKIEINARLGGALRKKRIKVLLGDFVRIALSASDVTQGRIIWRYKKSDLIKADEPVEAAES